MSRNKLESEDMESSSSEEAEEEEDKEKEEEESSSEDDEFDSTDERVNMVPSEKAFAQGETSEESESDEEEEEEEEPMKLTIKAAESERIEGIKHFDSDVESEYETESSSESGGLSQKPMVKESSFEAVEALPLTQKKKPKKDDISVNEGIAYDDHAVKKSKNKAFKEQQDPKPAKTNEEENPPAKKGQGDAVKQILKDNEQSQSVKDEKKGSHSAKKRKVESLQYNGETDSADSVPIQKRRKDAAHNGKAGADRGKPAHTLSDTGKEIARKTLSDPCAKPNGSKDVSNNKVPIANHVPMQEKKANTDSSKGPPSPQKQKKLPHVWSTDEEILMASEVLNRVKTGLEVPSKRNDDFWLTLTEILHKKLGVEFTRDQLSEKLRRMKQRYQGAAQKIKESYESQKPYKYKKSNEQNLFDIWSQIWGRAEVTSLDDHQAANDFKEEPSKPFVVAASFDNEAKNSTKVSKTRSASSKAKASKEDAAAIMENSVGRDALLLDRSMTTPMELDKGEAAKEDHAKDGLSSLPDESAVLSKDVHELLQDKIHTTLDELQKWSKNSMEAWMNKALALIDNTVKTLGDQAIRMNAVGIAGGGLPMRLCDSMEFQFVHGEQAFQQKWYELHLQELNIYAQRLELMRKECELKQEQLKLQLQVERGNS